MAGTEASGLCCLDCIHWHQHALEVLGGETPQGCQVCKFTWDALKELSGSAEVKMYAVPKDGIYQLLCGACMDRYVRKRADLYGNTQFGAQLKLK
jgi:hypothetical protein